MAQFVSQSLRNPSAFVRAGSTLNQTKHKQRTQGTCKKKSKATKKKQHSRSGRAGWPEVERRCSDNATTELLVWPNGLHIHQMCPIIDEAGLRLLILTREPGMRNCRTINGTMSGKPRLAPPDLLKSMMCTITTKREIIMNGHDNSKSLPTSFFSGTESSSLVELGGAARIRASLILDRLNIPLIPALFMFQVVSNRQLRACFLGALNEHKSQDSMDDLDSLLYFHHTAITPFGGGLCG
ncbi:hypothetical protein EJ08DRAFT_664672 [Tothia fuscella]|uniref:Uncharacterized protein n=1 Tax=Tothia fuscella TaxID=1048955 RepID=A0A9P4NI60_9PEZI|nr:hypothetical protein EJ08DRAFT_664672 [Tothia fuscella]